MLRLFVNIQDMPHLTIYMERKIGEARKGSSMFGNGMLRMSAFRYGDEKRCSPGGYCHIGNLGFLMWQILAHFVTGIQSST